MSQSRTLCRAGTGTGTDGIRGTGLSSANASDSVSRCSGCA